MQLVEALVHNPVKVSVGVVLVVLFGGIAVTQMPMELTPQVERPMLSLSTRWRGAGPEEVEREIIYEQEEQLKAVPGMVKMTSESKDSFGRISMEFAVGTDMSESLVRMNTMLQQVREYPEDAGEPVIWSSSGSSSPIAAFNLIPRPPSAEQIAEFQRRHPEFAELLEPLRGARNATLVLQRLKALAKQHPELSALQPPDVYVPHMTQFAEEVVSARLARVPGVARIWVWGGEDMEMQVVVDPQRLAARQLTIADVRQALRGENQDTSGGDFREGKRRYVVRTMGRYRHPKQVEDTILADHDGAPVYVRDVAAVRLGYKKPRESDRHFDTPCIWLGVVKEPSFNIMEAMAEIKRARDDLNSGILKQRNLYLHQSSDDSLYINSAMGLVRKNIVLGGMLTIGVLLLFLRSGRSTLVVALAIPVSIIGTFLLLGMMGRSLNVISLAGMAFAVGMLVDNAVVVLENIYRHYQSGDDPLTAAVRGTKEVWGALLASTLTTLAVFIPVLFVQEEAGQLFRDIALAISCGVGLSLLISVSVIPTAAARILRQRAPDKGSRPVLSQDGRGPDAPHRQAAVLPSGRAATTVAGEPRGGRPLPAGMNGMRERESRGNLLSRSVDRVARALVDAVVGINARLQRSVPARLAIVSGFVIGSLLISYVLLPPIEYLPQGNRNAIRGSMIPPPGYSTEQMLAIGGQFHDAIRPYSALDPSSPEAKQLELPSVADFSYGIWGRSVWISVSCADPARVRELLPYLNDVIKKIPGTEGFISQASLFQGGWMSAGRQVDIEISGPELTKLVALGTRIRDQVRVVIPDAQAYATPSLDLATPELHIVPKKAQAAAMGVRASELGYTIDALVDGAYASDFFHQGNKIDLTIIGQDQFTSRTQDLEAVPVAVPTGQVVPLAALADVELTSGPDEIAHIERQRAITIHVTAPDEIALGEVIQRIQQEIVEPLEASGELEGLYQLNLSGTADRLNATWAALRFNFLLALVITYLLMAALFESWLYPFVIMVSVPLAAVGGLAGLRLINMFVIQQLDILTMLGFIILVGTVVNNAILIVHQSLNHMRLEGLSAQEAILVSVRGRIRPIFMTTFTTVFGLLPLVLFPGAGSELYRGLGSVVLGGLIVSTMFTLVLVPTLFSLTMEAKAAWLVLLGRVPTEETAQAPVRSPQLSDTR